MAQVKDEKEVRQEMDDGNPDAQLEKCDDVDGVGTVMGAVKARSVR